jgi:hypothetical protein
MRLDDETAVRWAEVADDEFIWDSLSMQRYYRYLREKYVDTCDPPPQGFKGESQALQRRAVAEPCS